jgi:dimethylglycine dehydrogenase
MKDTARCVVIGGGVVGCSVLYHLSKAGWRDVVLLERSELTSGSTWHAAGGMHTLNGDPNVAKLQQYTINLYREIEEISGQNCGVHLPGGIMLAGTRERLDWLKMAQARGRYLGMETEIISPREAAERMPLIDPKHFVGALCDPMEGHVDPNGVTNAYAKAARVNGAEVQRHTRVTALEQRVDGSWTVITDKGDIHAEHVVNAGGLWAREVGRMVGLELPVLAMEHMYLLTENMPDVETFNQETGLEVGHCIDFEGELYLRQEGKGMLLGTYERAGVPWAPHSTPWDFDTELLEPDLDRIEPSLNVALEHFPAFQTAGIKQVINGPFTFSPDGNPLIGPIRGLRNYWVACAVMAGFSQGGGVGLALSNWMIEGDPGFDIWAMDVARFGDWASPVYTDAKVRENYSSRFRIRFPNEELPAARPLKTTPVYERLASRNAVFGDSWGLEHALWFAPDGSPAEDIFSFRRSTDFDAVAAEARGVREGVGLLEISSFAKYEVTGPDAEFWLNRLLPGRLPKRGRLALSPMLNEQGRLIGDFTVARMGDERFLIFGSGIAEQYHMRWFLHQAPDRGVSIRALGLDLLGLQIAGPKSRELLARVTDRDVSHSAFRFMAIDCFHVGALPATVSRVTFTGDLGYELWIRPEYQRSLYDLLIEAGEDLGIRPFGGRALNSLRLEKNWGTWAREYRPTYTPWEAGLGRFVDADKPGFIGRDPLLTARDAGPERQLLAFVVDAADADVIGDEPVWRGEEVVGWVTSGGYAHWSGRSVALGYVRTDAVDSSADDYSIEIIGDRRPARIQGEPLFDPEGQRMRG